MEERQRQSVFGKETIQRGVLKGSEASGWCCLILEKNLENFGDRDFHTPSFQVVKSQDTRMTSKYRLSIESYCNFKTHAE